MRWIPQSLTDDEVRHKGDSHRHNADDHFGHSAPAEPAELGVLCTWHASLRSKVNAKLRSDISSSILSLQRHLSAIPYVVTTTFETRRRIQRSKRSSVPASLPGSRRAACRLHGCRRTQRACILSSTQLRRISNTSRIGTTVRRFRKAY